MVGVTVVKCDVGAAGLLLPIPNTNVLLEGESLWTLGGTAVAGNRSGCLMGSSDLVSPTRDDDDKSGGGGEQHVFFPPLGSESLLLPWRDPFSP